MWASDGIDLQGELALEECWSAILRVALLDAEFVWVCAFVVGHRATYAVGMTARLSFAGRVVLRQVVA